MNVDLLAPVAVVLEAAYDVVSALADSLDPVLGGSSAAGAIVLITLALRLVLIPVGAAQVRAELTRRRLAPRLRELQRRHKTSPEVLRRKMLELYTSEKATPLAGVLPTLAQAPLLSVVYALFTLPTVNGHANALLAEQAFGAPLGSSLAHLLSVGAVGPELLVYAALLLVIAAVAFVARRVALRRAEPEAANAPALRGDIGSALSWLPFISVLFAALVPLAATLYLAVTTTWTLAERALLRRRISPAL